MVVRSGDNESNRTHFVAGRVSLRWRLWSWVSDLPGTCVATAYSRIIDKQKDAPIRRPQSCIDDQARNGSCWCNKYNAAEGRP